MCVTCHHYLLLDKVEEEHGHDYQSHKQDKDGDFQQIKVVIWRSYSIYKTQYRVIISACCSFPEIFKTIFLLAEGSREWNTCRLHQVPSEFVRQNLKRCPSTSCFLLRDARTSFLQETSESVPEACGISVQEEWDSQLLSDRTWPWVRMQRNTDVKASEAGPTCRCLKNKTSRCSLQAQDSLPQP